MNKLPWFTHDHNARQDLFIRRLMDRFGHFGYAAYFIILELLHQHGTGDTLLIPERELAQELRTRWPQVRLLLDFCRTSGKVQFTLSSGEVELQIKKFRERQSKMKSNLPSTFRQPSVNLPLEGEGEGEGERENVLSRAAKTRKRRTRNGKEKTAATEPGTGTPAKAGVPAAVDLGSGVGASHGSQPSAALAPVIKQRTPIQIVVDGYKAAKNVDLKDGVWDRVNYPRYSKSAKNLLDAFNGSVEKAVAYTLCKGDEFDQKSMSWTLETIARHAIDDRGKLGETKNDDEQQKEVGRDRLLADQRGPRTAQAGKIALPFLDKGPDGPDGGSHVLGGAEPEVLPAGFLAPGPDGGREEDEA